MSTVMAPSRTPGPGLLEACGWTLLYVVAQAVAGALCVLVLLLAAYEGWPPDGQTALNLLLDLNLDSNFMLIGVTQLGTLFLIVPAVRWRLGAPLREKLQLGRPERRTLLPAIGAVAPLAVLSRALYELAHDQWQRLVQDIPALEPLTRANSLESIASQTAAAPFFVLVVALALGPALGEEIVFRGLIGPGLLRRWGVPVGVLLTSVLFAGVHGFPPHAVATLPLAFFLHYAFLRTGSLWSPILLHFLNNALAVAMLKYPLLARLPDSPAVVAAAALYVVAAGVLLGPRRERAATATSPLPGASLVLHSRWFEAFAGSSIAGFTTTFVWSVVAN
ncbi:MAG: CPBP family intramembrane glutamic endopeptidase [Planctomycetaceae bacterium]